MKKTNEPVWTATDGTKFFSAEECLKHERADPIAFLSAAFKVDEVLLSRVAEGSEPHIASAMRAIMTLEYKAREAAGKVKRRAKGASEPEQREATVAPTTVEGVTTNAPQDDDDGSEEQ
jgi:hypothetical protein